MQNEKQCMSEKEASKAKQSKPNKAKQKPDRVLVDRTLSTLSDPSKIDSIFDAIERQNRKYTIADFLSDERVREIVKTQRARGLDDKIIKQGIEQMFSVSISAAKWKEAFPPVPKKDSDFVRDEDFGKDMEVKNFSAEKVKSDDLTIED